MPPTLALSSVFGVLGDYGVAARPAVELELVSKPVLSLPQLSTVLNLVETPSPKLKIATPNFAPSIVLGLLGVPSALALFPVDSLVELKLLHEPKILPLQMVVLTAWALLSSPFRATLASYVPSIVSTVVGVHLVSVPNSAWTQLSPCLFLVLLSEHESFSWLEPMGESFVIMTP